MGNIKFKHFYVSLHTWGIVPHTQLYRRINEYRNDIREVRQQRIDRRTGCEKP